jgi:hypothetical protein
MRCREPCPLVLQSCRKACHRGRDGLNLRHVEGECATRLGGDQDPPRANPWHDPEVPGKLVDVAYTELPRPVPLSEFGTEFQRLLPGRHSPLTHDGQKGIEGYLFELPRDTGLWLEEPVAPHLKAAREQAR